MKFLITTFADLLDAPGGQPKAPLSPNMEAVGTGNVTPTGDFTEATVNGEKGWLAKGTFEVLERDDLDPEVFVSQCIIVERTVNNREQTKPWYVSADYLIARAIIETKLENSKPKVEGLDAVGPLQVSSAEWKRFLDAEGTKAGFLPSDFDDYIMQVWGAAFTMFSDAKSITQVRRQNGEGSDSDPPLPTYLEVFLTYLTGSAKAAAALADATADGKDKGQDGAAAGGGPENPDKGKKLNAFLKDKVGMVDSDIAAVFKRYSDFTGSNDANSKSAGDFVIKAINDLNDALQKAFELIKKHAPETLLPIGRGIAPWFDIAKQELAAGVREDTNEGDRRIVEYFREINFPTNTSKTPWCAAFVAFCMKKSGNPAVANSVPRQSPALAATWRGWAEALPINSTDIPPGAVVVLSPTEEGDSSGHVSFFARGDKNTVTLLGGNQSNRVKESTYARSRVVAIRWMNLDMSAPAGGPVPVGNIKLTSLSASQRPMAELIIQKFAAAGYGTPQQIAAVANAMRESNLNPNLRNITSQERSIGLFQLNMRGGVGAGHSEAELLDPSRNIEITIAEAKKFREFGDAKTFEDAIKVFVHRVERPANQDAEIADRIAKARTLVA